MLRNGLRLEWLPCVLMWCASGVDLWGGFSAPAAEIFVDVSSPCPGAGIPGDPFCSIQAALVAAVSGADRIRVSPGTYNEAIDVLGKAVVLESTDGPFVTTIDASGLSSSVVRCVNGEGPDTVVAGFTLTGGDPSGGFGGAMEINFSDPTILNCVLTSNHASFNGGGMYNLFSSPTVVNCLFSNNVADFNGGGLYNSTDSHPAVLLCTFSQNTSGSGSGGGIFNFDSTVPTFTNCIVWGNVGGAIGGSGVPDVTFSAIEGGFAGTGNVAADPLLVTGPQGDFYLSQVAAGQAADSPCVDAGSDHRVRFFLKGTTRTDEVGDVNTVDMGFHYNVCLGSPDLDGDNDVDGTDFLTFSNCFNGSLNPPVASCLNASADHDCDGDVDGTDFLTFSNCFNGALNPPLCP